MLAEAWYVADDELRWTFHLRKGVQFHFGWGELTAKDVAHSVQMLAGERSRAGSASFWREAVKEVEVIDDRTVSFVLARPVPDLMRLVSSEGHLMILSRAQWDAEREAGMGRRPAGTGPYRFVDRRAGDFIKFQRVKGHWRKVPEFEELVIISSPDGETRRALLLTGEVHIAVLPRDLPVDLASSGFELMPSPLPVNVWATPNVVREYVFPGNIKGSFSHLEYVVAAR